MMNKPKFAVIAPFVTIVLSFHDGFCQQKQTVEQIKHLADSLYKAKQYSKAVTYYSQLIANSDFPIKKAVAYYDMACSLNLQGKTDSALVTLNEAIVTGYDNKAHFIVDGDLVSLHDLPQWKSLVSSITETEQILNTDPAKIKLVTTDIHNFWNAYDKALADTANFREIFKREYFDKGSKGMQDYMGNKVSSIDFFIQHIRSAPIFYSAIRENMLKIDGFKPVFLADFAKLKSLYPDSRFPDIYFMIGAFTSGGTVSATGLLIGANQCSLDPKIPVDELNFRLRTRVQAFKNLPNMVCHELVHYEQKGMKRDTTTLAFATTEGMADFIGELISGNTANPALHLWAKGKEQKIWDRFKKDMYFNRYSNWIANSQQATADNLPDQGYWIGYQICKAYYEQSDNKKQAIDEMLHIQDYKSFLAKSKWENKLAMLPQSK